MRVVLRTDRVVLRMKVAGHIEQEEEERHKVAAEEEGVDCVRRGAAGCSGRHVEEEGNGRLGVDIGLEEVLEEGIVHILDVEADTDPGEGPGEDTDRSLEEEGAL